VLAVATDAGGAGWLRVRLPGRPNSHTGWIAKRATTEAEVRWRLVVDVGARRVTAFRDGVAQRVYAGVVGKPSTPTPLGEFFVEEAVAVGPGEVGGPYALALSGRSTVFQEFDGGPGQIAIHGLRNVGGTPGTAASHGCVRLADAAMRWLVERIGPGVPVTVRA
jgi:lipoprotein-anchoring transpeptidase ErfK/SrfK